MSVLEPVTAPEDAVVRARNLTKTYGKGNTAVEALKSVDVALGRGEFTAIMGPSGSGKSTLMHCLAGLDTISGGEVTLDDQAISNMSERALTKLRRDRIGFIFQSFNLIPTLTAAENITLPADIAKQKISKERFDQVVDAVGLRDRLSHRPAEMSGGQQQRVACARALVTQPAVVFADEPTGNLDSRSSTQVLSFLREAASSMGQTVVMVTHDPTAASYADRVLFLVDGRVVAQVTHPTRDIVLDALRELDDHTDAAEAEAGTETAPLSKADEAASAGSPTAHLNRGLEEHSPSRPGSTTASPDEALAGLQPAASETAVEEGAAPSRIGGDAREAAPAHAPRRVGVPVEQGGLGFEGQRPSERLDEALRRMAPAGELDEETLALLRQAQEILHDLPGSVIPEDDLELTGQIPIVKRAPRHAPRPNAARAAGQDHESEAGADRADFQDGDEHLDAGGPAKHSHPEANA